LRAAVALDTVNLEPNRCRERDWKAACEPLSKFGRRQHDPARVRIAVLRATLHRVTANTPRIEITYCTQCRWLLRAAWMAQELLTTFQSEIGEVALIPGTGGIFRSTPWL
jgi:hypothetical protein